MRNPKQKALEISGRGPVTLRVLPRDETTATLEIDVDYSTADVPNLHYDADFCEVLRTRTGIALCFGKLAGGEENLRSKIEITWSEEHFYRGVWVNSRRLVETVANLSRGHELNPVAPSNLRTLEKVQTFHVSTVFISVMASEAVLDFYYISPGDVHHARTGRKNSIDLNPVIRVSISTPLLNELLQQVIPFGELLEKEYGNDHKTAD